jgi:hypothetical protein
MTSFLGSSIAIVETSNIIDHQLHLEFPLIKFALIGLLTTFIIGLILTYRNQKTPDRIKEKILTKFEKWESTQSIKFKLNTTELLNVKLFPDLLSEKNFDKFIEASKQNNTDGNTINKLLPILNIILLIVFFGAGIFFYVKLGKASNTIEKELPEFLQLIKEGKSGAAYYAGDYDAEYGGNDDDGDDDDGYHCADDEMMTKMYSDACMIMLCIMTHNELNEWFVLYKRNKLGLLSSSEYKELIRLNHLVMEISHAIHNDHQVKAIV